MNGNQIIGDIFIGFFYVFLCLCVCICVGSLAYKTCNVALCYLWSLVLYKFNAQLN